MDSGGVSERLGNGLLHSRDAVRKEDGPRPGRRDRGPLGALARNAAAQREREARQLLGQCLEQVVGGDEAGHAAFGSRDEKPPHAGLLHHLDGLRDAGRLGHRGQVATGQLTDLRLGRVCFHFDADSMDWLKLFLGNIALVIGTLGIGIAFVGYRNWSFFIHHLGASGEIDELHQSTTHVPRDAEGLLDAFDFGAV